MEKLETSSRERGGRLNSGRIRHCRRTCTSAYFQRACTEHGKRARWRARGVDDGRRGWRWGSAAGGMGGGRRSTDRGWDTRGELWRRTISSSCERDRSPSRTYINDVNSGRAYRPPYRVYIRDPAYPGMREYAAAASRSEFRYFRRCNPRAGSGAPPGPGRIMHFRFSLNCSRRVARRENWTFV